MTNYFRYTFILIIAALCFACSQSPSHEKPNIIVVLADDLGYGDIRGYNPESKIPTPNLDMLMNEGVSFTDAHTNSSVCTPTRYGILTGRYAWRTRLKSRVLQSYNHALIHQERTTIASMLKNQGYQTTCIGKWHLGVDWETEENHPIPYVAYMKPLTKVDFTKPFKNGPTALGFDYFFGIISSANIPPFTFTENDRVVEIPTIEKPDSIEGRPGLMVPGWTHKETLPALTQKAVEYIDTNGNKEKPFFMYFPLTAPHTPIAPTDGAKGKSQAGKYGDFVTDVDWTMGQLMEVLEKKEIAENTLIIFTSDNGSPARTGTYDPPGSVMEQFNHQANGNLKGLKGDIWEAGHRVPFIVKWPEKVGKDTKSDQLVCTTDIFGTIAELINYKLKQTEAEDSFSFLASLTGETSKEETRKSVVHHSHWGKFSYRKGNWKYVESLGSGGFSKPRYIHAPADSISGQLYNLQEDIFEQKNVWGEHPEKVAEFAGELAQIQLQGFSRPLAEKAPALSFMEKFKPAPLNGGFRMDGYWVWGMSVIKGEDGKYHGFASRWKKNVPFGTNWVTNSEIVHAVSENPEGPYEFSEVVFERRGKEYWDGMMTHNPTIHKVGDTYLLFYIGTTYDFPFPTSAVTQEQKQLVRGNQRIGLATSKSPYGPWKKADQPILDVRPGKWDAYLTVNPAVCVKPDGSILLVYKSASHKTGLLKLGVASAKSYDAKFERLIDEPIFQFGETSDSWDAKGSKHVEDPYIWFNGTNYELIMKDMAGNICGEKGGGIHATSENGLDWEISEIPQAYSRMVLWGDGKFLQQAAFERPQLLIQDGKPTHLFVATGRNSEGKYWNFEETWNMCIPLAE